MSIEQYRPGTEVALSTQDAAVTRLAEWAHSADAAYQVAQRLSDSAFVPQQFRGKPVETTAAILAGLEVGLSPMQAIRSFDIISGTAAPRAITLRALVQSRGHEMVLVESNATRCKMKGKRKDSDEWQSVTWTMDRAKDLGLTGKDNWKKQPAAMLVARATSELARLVASDAILGIGYSSEEIADGGNYEAEVSEVTTAPTAPAGTRKMSRRTTPAPELESPLLDVESDLAKAMFATMNDLGITIREDRLDFAADVLRRPVESSKVLTDDDAHRILDYAKAKLEAVAEHPERLTVDGEGTP